MDASRNENLGEIAADAVLERREFLVQATEQLRKFLAANADRIKDAGGFVLIDEEPDYLAVAPDGTFRSRTRYQDEASGKWVSETEVIESAAELVELYNPAEVYASFAEAARVAAGLDAEPTAAEDLFEVAGLAPGETVEAGYAGAADAWAATTGEIPVPDDPAEAARVLYDLALTYQERSQEAEAALIEEFESAARELAGKVGDILVLDEDDERLIFTGAGRFVAEVVPEEAEGEWKRLSAPSQLVEFYDPTDVFGDLADALADAFEGIAPEDEGAEDADEADDEGEEADDDGDGGGPRADG